MSLLDYQTLPATDTVYPGRKIDFILGAAQRLASSYGLQPLKIFLIKDESVSRYLAPFIHSEQTKDAHGALILFAIWNSISEEKIDEYISTVAAARNTPAASLREDRRGIIKAISRLNEEGRKWAARQADIAVKNVVKAAEEVEAKLNEVHFDAAAFEEILGLAEQGLKPVRAIRLAFDVSESVPLTESSVWEKQYFTVI